MPTKHKRSRADNGKGNTNLAPSEVAEPLSTKKGARENGIFTSESAASKKGNKRKRKNDTDDTPRAWSRLMAFQQGKKLPSGLDDGTKPTKKQRRDKAAEDEGKNEKKAAVAVKDKPAAEIPTIKPGEKMSDFAARVDAALPISGLINKTAKNGRDPLGLKVQKTKTEKRLHKMYDEWRNAEAKIQERRQEAMEIAEEEEFDDEGKMKWKGPPEEAAGKKKGKGKKKALGEVDDGDDDPWAVLKAKRAEGPNRISDTYQAPPTFTNIPKEKFKVRGARVNVEDVPKAAGSLRRREELGEVRRTIVEEYRAMMQRNKDAAAQAKEQSK